MIKLAFYTLGCKTNQYETDTMKRLCALRGFTIVPFEDSADVYVINSCTVTGRADKKSNYAIRQAKKKNKNSVVIVTGCYVDAGQDMLYTIKEADILLKNNDKRNILNYLPKIKGKVEEKKRVPQRVRANLMIENGCENFCSYCIVPYVRGKIASKPLRIAISEAKQMVEDGVKEIVLTGINIGEYGKNITKVEYHLDDHNIQSHISEKNALPQLIEELSKIDGLERIRLSSIEPMYVDDSIIKIVKDNPKVCKHLHIPLQSGDDKILKAMNRTYTSKDFIKLIKKVRKHIKNLAVTTDIIVGFPGEDEKAFKNSCKLAEKLKFSRIHIFSYSERPKTAAYNLSHKIHPGTITERYDILNKIRAKQMLDTHRSFKNKVLNVLIEYKDKRSGMFEGLTSNYIRVFFEGDELGDDSRGKLFPAKIKGFHKEHVTASLPTGKGDKILL